jgi:hypothetical protein
MRHGTSLAFSPTDGERHDDCAPARCVGRAARFGLQGDRDGEAAWLAIERAAKSLLETGPPTDIDPAEYRLF